MPDIIISDIAMPGINGLAAALKIRAAHPEARFIFVSVHDDPAVIRKALAEGARGYVVKSDAGDELADADSGPVAVYLRSWHDSTRRIRCPAPPSPASTP